MEMFVFLVFAAFAFSSSSRKIMFFSVPLGSTVTLTASNCIHTGTPSAMTGMRRDAGGRQPAAARPTSSLCIYFVYILGVRIFFFKFPPIHYYNSTRSIIR